MLCFGMPVLIFVFVSVVAAKIQGLKSGVSKGDKKRKKEVQLEIDALEQELKVKHDNELKLIADPSNQVAAAAVDEASDKLDTMALGDCKENSNEDEQEPCAATHGGVRVSKAQKRRDKKLQQDKERQERIANTDCSDLNKSRADEEARFKEILLSKGLRIVDVPSDGDCMYKALSHQLSLNGIYASVADLRTKTGRYIREHKDDFVPFLTSDKTGDLLDDDEFDTYCDSVSNTKAWGGQVELQALVKILDRAIQVIQANGPDLLLGDDKSAQQRLIISYHRHAYHLGEHYNSVIKSEQ